MKQIYSPKENLMSILGPQKIDLNKNYRIQNFVIHEEIKDNLVLYNNFTKAALVLDRCEIKSFKDIDLNSQTVKKLIEGWFFVPEDFDEIKVFNQLRDIVVEIKESKDKDDNLKTFVILPTTDCNARCYYCYEIGCEKTSMDDKRAKDVAKFIINKVKPEKKVTISWFGGEPLVGMKAINTICQTLVDDGFELSSSMISNGFLFDDDVVKQAKELWNLKSVQITLDGTKDVYNKAKDYISNCKNPFKKVIDNIELLVNNNIRVVIRLNLSPENEGDIEKLIEYMNKRFSSIKDKECNNHKLLGVYTHTLFQEINKTGISRARSDKTLKECYERESKINDLLIKYNMFAEGSLPRSFRINHCMADAGHSAVILPSGEMTSCEHFNDSLPYWGSIYDDDYDQDILNEWKQRYPEQESCKTCAYYPSCLRLKNCPNTDEICKDEEREWNIHKMHIQLKNTYEQWLINGNKTKDNQLEALSD